VKITFLTFLLFAFINCKAQNPETGWFWSLKMNESVLNKSSGKYEGMGWSETSTGKYAFEFSSTYVTVYSDGWMGKNYRENHYYAVDSRKMVDQTDEITTYLYATHFQGKDVQFIVKVINSNEYKLANIFIYEDLIVANNYEKVRVFTCSRQYK
jgi:hypothetical protein